MRVLLDETASEALIKERCRLGQDRHDEVWAGVYHVSPHAYAEHDLLAMQVVTVLGNVARAGRAGRPDLDGFYPSLAFNLGDPGDYRIPDFGFHVEPPRGVWIPECPIVGEVLSPGDEALNKLGFYRAHGVLEVVVVDPVVRRVAVFADERLVARSRAGSTVARVADGGAVDGARLTAALVWP